MPSCLLPLLSVGSRAVLTKSILARTCVRTINDTFGSCTWQTPTYLPVIGGFSILFSPPAVDLYAPPFSRLALTLTLRSYVQDVKYTGTDTWHIVYHFADLR